MKFSFSLLDADSIFFCNNFLAFPADGPLHKPLQITDLGEIYSGHEKIHVQAVSGFFEEKIRDCTIRGFMDVSGFTKISYRKIPAASE